MTIREFLADLEKTKGYKTQDGKELNDGMLDMNDVWDNYACKGYCIKAMQYAEFTPEQIREVVKKLHWAFDDLTIEDATKIGEDY